VLAPILAGRPLADQVRSIVRNPRADDLSVAALARQINLSERQFTRVFKSEVGVTAAGYVEAVRVESACRPLETTNRTIEQIARTCGFGTPETMNRTFRRRLNTTAYPRRTPVAQPVAVRGARHRSMTRLVDRERRSGRSLSAAI